MITVLADQHHYLLEQHLHPSIRLEKYDPESGWSDQQIHEADALLVRTVSPVNSKTLPSGSNIRFVGTASAGRDHLDEHWLESQNIRVADAAGSNARSVGEYVAFAILSFLEAHGMQQTGKKPKDIARHLTAGIVGAGNTGHAAADLLQSLGISCSLYDPPRQERERGLEGGFESVTLDEVLSCDIISFHVPLERTGKHATWHWYNEEKIRSAPKKLVINASRGGVVDENALRNAARDRHISEYICDVWEDEPFFDDESARGAFLATPHIAGYSIEAKLKATVMVCRRLHQFFGLPEPEPPVQQPQPVSIPDSISSLSEILRILHPAYTYDASLRELIGQTPEQKGPAFRKLRQDLPLRNEFGQIEIPAPVARRYPVLTGIGFRPAETKQAGKREGPG